MPIYCKPQIYFTEDGGRVDVIVGTKGTTGQPIRQVAITIPFTKTVGTAHLSCTQGSVFFDDMNKVRHGRARRDPLTRPVAQVAQWNVGDISPQAASPQLSGTVTIATGQRPPSQPPTILLNFLAPFLASGLKIDSYKIHNETYKLFKGVKCMTKAGSFQVRS